MSCAESGAGRGVPLQQLRRALLALVRVRKVHVTVRDRLPVLWQLLGQHSDHITEERGREQGKNGAEEERSAKSEDGKMPKISVP